MFRDHSKNDFIYNDVFLTSYKNTLTCSLVFTYIISHDTKRIEWTHKEHIEITLNNISERSCDKKIKIFFFTLFVCYVSDFGRRSDGGGLRSRKPRLSRLKNKIKNKNYVPTSHLPRCSHARRDRTAGIKILRHNKRMAIV